MRDLKGPFRLAVVNSHPIQYFAPMYAWVDRDPSLEITALYCSDHSLRGGDDAGFGRAVRWDVDLLAGYRSVFLPGAGERTPAGFWSLVVPGLWREIRSGRYDGVWLHGYGFAAYVLAFLAAKSAGLPVFMRSETHLKLARPGWKRRLRDRVLSLAYRAIDGFLAVGTLNRQYYLSLGVPSEKIQLVPYTVDNARFIHEAEVARAGRLEARCALGIPNALPMVLFASKFQPRKHPVALLEAVAALQRSGTAVGALFVGSGELEPRLRKMVAEEAIRDIHFLGFLNQSQLAAAYVMGDVFALPSTDEPWAFIINEVMCAGLPLVVSADIGCVPDLVREGVNGMTVVGGDAASVRAALAWVLADTSRREAMGRASLETIQAWNYDLCRSGLVAAVEAVMADRQAHAR